MYFTDLHPPASFLGGRRELGGARVISLSAEEDEVLVRTFSISHTSFSAAFLSSVPPPPPPFYLKPNSAFHSPWFSLNSLIPSFIFLFHVFVFTSSGPLSFWLFRWLRF
jgi:hypothetical protein